MSKGPLARSADRRRAAFIDAFEFPPGYTAKLAAALPDLDPARHDEVIAGLRQFFQVCRIADGTLVGMPSRAVDEAWHCLILFTRDYARLCDGAFKRFLHHTPEAGIAGPDMQVANTRAWAIACQVEDMDPRAPERAPLLFRIDADLGLAGAPQTLGLSDAIDRDLPALSARLDGKKTRGAASTGCAAVVGDAGGASCGASGCGGASCGGGSCGGGSCGGGGCGGG
jgi:hypothetical protein